MMKNVENDKKLTIVHRNKNGFTIVEMILALGITAMVGVAVSAMLVSISYGTTNQTDLRRADVKERVLGMRISDAIQSSEMILAQGSDHLILWMGDSRENGLPDLSEIRRIDWDVTDQEMWSYSAPFDLLEANNTTYNFVDDFNTITLALMGTSNFPGEPWAHMVTGWTQTLDQVNPQAAKMIQYTVTLSGSDVVSVVTNTVSLRKR